MLQLKVNSKNIEHFSMRCMSYIKSEQQLDKIYQKQKKVKNRYIIRKQKRNIPNV